MSENTSGSNSDRRTVASTQRTVRRYFRRTDEPRSWWPGGLLPLLGLLLLFLWGLFKIAPDIQEQTHYSVQTALSNSGYEQMGVSVDGQQVVVSGRAPETDSDRIKHIAQGATCDALVASNLVCPTHVSLELDATNPGRFHDFSFSRSADGVVLRGEVPDAATRDRLVNDARARFGEVTDSLRISGDVAGLGYEWAAGKSWAFLDLVETGRVSWMNGSLSAIGRTTRDLEERIRGAFASARFPDRIGDLQLQFMEEVNQCNEQFQAALSASTIRFQTASATISARSRQLLRQLADVANTCPGNLVVEGHTDSDGALADNQALSLRRARAVVGALTDLGVASNRLSARGFGEERPVASNATSSGRAQNRRIEIKVADIN